MSKIPRSQHLEQLAVFKQLDLNKPMTVSQVQRLMQAGLGYLPGRKWVTARMREGGLLLSRLEALALITCPIHKRWMNGECAICTKEVEPLPIKSPRGLPPETIEAMKADRAKGLSFGAIAEKHNVSRSHAFRIARE